MPSAALSESSSSGISVHRRAPRPGSAATTLGARRGAARQTDALIHRARLVERLESAGRLTMLSAPAGAGKTSLLRSWLSTAGKQQTHGWVSARSHGLGPHRFWDAVADAVAVSTDGTQAQERATNRDTWEIAAGLLDVLEQARKPICLVIDDLEQLHGTESEQQVEWLLAHAPENVRVALASRREMTLGLHRARLEGELTEIRAGDLRFTSEEARLLFEAAGVELSEPALQRIVVRTEGWAAGLRLAALAARGDSDPESFALQFSGTQRLVAEYLQEEILAGYTSDVRRMLRRAAILDSMCAPLVNALSGEAHAERLLHELEQAGGFVTSTGGGPYPWYRVHGLVADLLRRELQQTEPGLVLTLHAQAAAWYLAAGHTVAAVRHAQAAGDWELAEGLLLDHWHELILDGEVAAARELVDHLPGDGTGSTSPQRAVLSAACEIALGSSSSGERLLTRSLESAAGLSMDRLEQLNQVVSLQRLRLGVDRGNLPEVLEHAELLLARSGCIESVRSADALRAAALLALGAAKLAARRLDEAKEHLEECLRLARKHARVRLESVSIGYLALADSARFSSTAITKARLAGQLASRHFPDDQSLRVMPSMAMARMLIGQGRLTDAGDLLQDVNEASITSFDASTRLTAHILRAMVEVARDSCAAALAHLRAAHGEVTLLGADHPACEERSTLMVLASVRLGEGDCGRALAEDRDARRAPSGLARIADAAVKLHHGDAAGALIELTPLTTSAGADMTGVWLIVARILEAQAQDELGNRVAAAQAIERALDGAEDGGLLLPFLLRPAPELLEQRRRDGTAHGALIHEILDALAGIERAPNRLATHTLLEPLSASELRVLRYLPTNLTAREIAAEMFISTHTVKTHMRHAYAKLDVHARAAAVKRARSLGLLGPARHAS